MKAHSYTVGDVVKYKAAFLQSIGWCTDVPRNGKVIDAKPMAHSDCFVRVEWSDGETRIVNTANVMSDKRPDYSGM